MGTQDWQYLIDKYLANDISKKELDQLLHMAEEQEDYAKLTAVLKKHWEEAKEKSGEAAVDWDTKFASMMEESRHESPVVLIRKKNRAKLFYRIAAAAVICITCAAAYWLALQKSKKDPEIISAPLIKKDIPAPASSNAILTLANGQKIVLDSASNGSLAMQGNTKIIKLADGQIVYNGKAAAAMQYNILTVPKGSKIASITLSDGTKVWLNAQSSLKYPVAFMGTERKVEITGEAYFEVAHNAAMPFKVQKETTQVTVLGTHFNINSYDDEPAIKVTLLQGAVKINKGTAVGILKPGQQAKIAADIKTSGDVDTDEVLAWINGKFQFGEAADIASVMKQISRWYNVEVEYKGTVTGHIGGTISRTENVSQVLKMLQMTGGVTFTIDEKKVIVMPK
jgi:ferric-dicitrate binding protein FerR (iron transport regulator)